MKIWIQRIFVGTGITTALMVQPVSASNTQCLIHYNAPCLAAGLNFYFRPYQWFKDVVTDANLNAGRCIERAREYRTWCGTPGITVYAIFQSGGVNVIGSYVSTNGVTRVTDGIARVTNLHD